MEFATAYLSQQQDALDKWKKLDLSEHPSLKSLPPVEALTPFYGSPYFSKLSAKQKETLYWGFFQFVAESLIVFEQMVLVSSRRLSRTYPRDIRIQALKAFALEEYYHLRAFRRYLVQNQIGLWPKALLIRNNKVLRSIYSWLLKAEPLCVIIPGAKAEIFSLQYTKYIKRLFASQNNDWLELNLMHSRDEVHHVGFDYKLMNSFLPEMKALKKLRLIVFTYLMFLGIQFIVVTGGFRLIFTVFEQERFLKKFKISFMFFKWSVRTFEPYRATHRQVKNLFEKKPFFNSTFFQPMTW